LCEFYGSNGAEALENQNNLATRKVLLFGAHKNLQLSEIELDSKNSNAAPRDGLAVGGSSEKLDITRFVVTGMRAS
jgi:hypothetical protein